MTGRQWAPLYSQAAAVNWGNVGWGKSLVRAAREAYDLACPHGTPRQLKAYSLGLSAFKTVQTSEEEPASEETEA
jgi:hypothetical protein